MDGNWKEYRDTGVLGAYHPEYAVSRHTEDGKVETFFRDTVYRVNNDELVPEREMLIGGKRFLVTSVFPDTPAVTPTEKMLSLIDMELEKDARSS